MRFYTLEKNGKTFPAVSADGGKTAYKLQDLGVNVASMEEFVRQQAQERVSLVKSGLATADKTKAINLNTVKICAPIMHPDQDLICLGINYDEHAKEAGKFSQEAFGGERPYTIYFGKRVSQASGTGDVIPSYEGLVDSLDYEAELGVVLGKEAKNVKADDALDTIFGFTIINDVTARNIQTRHKQWYMGKSMDGFTPMGPCIVTPDELGDYENLTISATVNGELRQNSNTKHMIQTVSGAIAEVSSLMTLKAGTIFSTGTPAGVGMGMNPPTFLKHGDKVCCTIEKIGTLENIVD